MKTPEQRKAATKTRKQIALELIDQLIEDNRGGGLVKQYDLLLLQSHIKKIKEK